VVFGRLITLQFGKVRRDIGGGCDLSSLDFAGRCVGGAVGLSGWVHEHLLQNDEDVWEGEAGHSGLAVRDSKKDQQQAKEKIKTTMESCQLFSGFEGGYHGKKYKNQYCV
jgi:hypothetical protein